MGRKRKNDKNGAQLTWNARVDAWAGRVAAWPRLVRILLAAFAALVTGALVAQIVSQFVGMAVLSDYSVINGILFISIAAGFVIYGVGWALLVGFDREAHPELGRGAVYYVLVIVLLLVILLGWFLIRAVLAYLPLEFPI